MRSIPARSSVEIPRRSRCAWQHRRHDGGAGDEAGHRRTCLNRAHPAPVSPRNRWRPRRCRSRLRAPVVITDTCSTQPPRHNAPSPRPARPGCLYIRQRLGHHEVGDRSTSSGSRDGQVRQKLVRHAWKIWCAAPHKQRRQAAVGEIGTIPPPPTCRLGQGAHQRGVRLADELLAAAGRCRVWCASPMVMAKRYQPGLRCHCQSRSMPGDVRSGPRTPRAQRLKAGR